MSASMRPWIETEVTRELAAATKWLKSDYRPSQALRKDRYTFEQDTLMVHFLKGKQVQVTEFHGQGDSLVDATVSDGRVCIRASFGQKTIDAFEEQYLRKFAEGTLGTLIVITEFYLTCSFKPRQSKPLSLNILAFKLLSSQRAATFGRPEDIETKVSSDISVLSDIFSKPLRDIHSPGSQAGDLTDREPLSLSGGCSQEKLSTQLHHLPEVHNTSEASTEPQKCRQEKGSALLSLLHSKREKAVEWLQEIPANTTTKCVSRKSTVLKSASLEEIAEMSSRLEARVNSHPSPHPSVQPPSSSINVVSQSVNFKEKEGIRASTPSILSETNEKKNSQESSLRRIYAVNMNSISKKTPMDDEQQQHSTSSVIKLSPGKDSFIGLSRMPRKYVRVPENQQKLLAREDSWMTDTPTAYPNVPPEVVETTDLFVGQMITVKSKARKAAKTNIAAVEVANGDESDSSSGSEGDNGPEVESKHSLVNISQKLPSSSQFIPDGIDDEGVTGSDQEGDTSDEEPRSWTPSPERVIKFMRQIPASKVGGSPRPQSEDHSSLQGDELEVEDADDEHAAGLNLILHGSEAGSHQDTNVQDCRIDKPIPSSSNYTDDDEMELAIPHAIGDEIQESDVEMEVSQSVQEIPSTAVVQRPDIVQVEQTPYSNQNVPGAYTSARGARRTRPTGTVSGAGLSSDPVIPSTFNDGSSQERNLKVQPPKLIAKTVATTTDDNNLHISEDGAMEGNSVHHQHSSQSQSPQSTKESSQALNLIPVHTVSSTSAAFCTNSEPMSGSGNPRPFRKTSSLSPQSLDPNMGSRAQMTAFDEASNIIQSTKRTSISLQDDDPEAPNKRHRSIGPPEDLDVCKGEQSISARMRAKRLAFKQILSMEPEHLRSTSHQLHSSPPRIQETMLDLLVPKNHTADELVGRVTNISPPHRTHAVQSPSNYSLADASADLANSNERTSVQCHKDAKIPTIDAVDPRREAGCESRTSIEPGSVYSSEDFSILHMFKRTYPSFDGGQRTFIKACVYLEFLTDQRRQPHPSLWDDFIRVFSSDFRKYVRRCKEAGEKPMFGIDFYNNEIVEPIFQRRIITPENLDEALCLETEEELERLRHLFREKDDARLRQSLLSERLLSVSAIHTPQNDECFPLQDDSSGSGVAMQSIQQSSKQDSKADITKKPFFETHSQLAAISSRVNNEASVEVINIDLLPKSRRSLPRSQADSPSSSKVEIGKKSPVVAPKMLLPSSASLGRHSRHKSLELEMGPSISHLRRSLGSPIPGNEDYGRLSSASALGITTHGSASSRKEGTGARSGHPVSSFQPVQSKPTGLPFSGTDDLDPVQGWLKNQPDSLRMTKTKKTAMEPPDPISHKVRSFLKSTQTYVPRKKRLSGISSTTSTPTSTPVAGLTTTGREKAAEPQTQA